MTIPILLISVFSVSCTTTGQEGIQNGTGTTFPELDAFTPENDVPSQKKSSKRGVCTNFRIAAMPDFLGYGVSWCYNWAHTPLDDSRKAMLEKNGITFYPMVWNAGFSEQNLGTFVTQGKDMYLLAYNEPNLKDQANMTPMQAASSWPQLVQTAQKLGLKIVGPAVNYGTLPGYGDPVTWYDEFLSQPGVSIDDIDAIALHCYMPTGEALKKLMIRKFKKYGKPVWLTEFENGEARSLPTQLSFCQESCTYLEADPIVERYAWFMDNTGGNNNPPHYPLVTTDETSIGGQPAGITELGRLYCGLSTFDKDNWYKTDVNIPAEHYSGQIVEDWAENDDWGQYVETYVTDDLLGNLEIRGLSGDKWVEYNIDLPYEGKYRVDLRYFASIDSAISIECKGAVSALEKLPETKHWTTTGVEIVLPQGKNVIRVKAPIGNLKLNWLRFTTLTN